MPTPPLTKPSTPRLSDLARHVAVPSGVVASGWPAVEKKCRDLGITFRLWQVGAGRLILAKRENGKYAATIGGTGLSIPRQVGKTFLVGAIMFALCLLRPGMTVMWTAHRMRTAEETFGKMQAFAKRRKIAPHVAKIVLGSGEEEIRFRNGSRILFGARERGFGLGFDEVDALIFDEAQRVSDAALDDMVPAANQSRQDTGALLLFLGTPPRPTDNGEVFKRMRREALSGEDEDTGWIEFGADPGFKPTPPPLPLGKQDWQQVEKANPSYPDDTPPESILRMRKKLGPESFLREGLGIWDDDGTGLIPLGKWSALGDSSSEPAPHVGKVVLAVDSDPDRKFTTIAACGARAAGPPMVEVTTDGDGIADNRAGVEWAAARVIAICGRNDVAAVVIDKASAANSLVQALKDANLPVVTTDTVQMRAACGQFFDAVTETGDLVHLGDPLLVTAVKAAVARKIGDAWVWDKANAEADITPLVAATLALWGHASGVGIAKNAGQGRAIALG